MHATIEILNLAVVTRHHKEQFSSQETLGISQRLVVSPYHQILGNSQDFGLSSGPVSECARDKAYGSQNAVQTILYEGSGTLQVLAIAETN